MQRNSSWSGIEGGVEASARTGSGMLDEAGSAAIHFLFQSFDLALQQDGNAMFDQVNLRDAHTDFLGHLVDRPFPKHATMKDLVMLRVSPGLDSLDRRLEEMLLPFRIPRRFESQSRRVCHPLHSRRPRRAIGRRPVQPAPGPA